MIVSKSIEFCAAHRVRTHNGKCKHMHGHQYKVTVHVAGSVADDGMVLDFGIVGQVLRQRVHDELDHGTVLAADDQPFALLLIGEDPDVRIRYTDGPPTAENLALWVVHQMATAPEMAGMRVVQVDVWETPTSCATLLVTYPALTEG